MDKFLKPREGLLVRDPKTMTPLSKEGEWKTFIGWQGRYWRRRVKCGDCVLIDESQKAVKIHKRKSD